MQEAVKNLITNELTKIEQDENIKILYSCESGSRAWGFASTDSDYDARFIYIRHPDWYLSINEKKDVIELPIKDELDINGWDIKKALNLVKKSNSVVYEWLQSPIVYRNESDFAEKMLNISSEYFSPRKFIHHYMALANRTLAEMKKEQVKLKKYFYVLRPILAAMWTSRSNQIPPMEFGQLMTIVEERTVIDAINALLEKKAASSEGDTIAHVEILDEFVNENLAECERIAAGLVSKKISDEKLNEFFRTLLRSLYNYAY